MYGYGWSGGRVGRRQEGQVGRGTRTFSFEFLGERGTGTGAHGASWSPSPAGHWVGVAVPFSDPIICGYMIIVLWPDSESTRNVPQNAGVERSGNAPEGESRAVFSERFFIQFRVDP